MKTTQTILQLLKVDYYTYDDLRHHYFLDWCYELSKKHHLPLQTLTRYNGLLNFYHDEWLAMVEHRTLHELEGYIKLGIITPQITLDWLEFEAKEIQNITPLPLIKMIKKELKNEKTNCKQRLVRE